VTYRGVTVLRITQWFFPLGRSSLNPPSQRDCASASTHTPARLRDQIQCTTKRHGCDAFAPVVPVDEEASEAVIRRLVETCVVLLQVVNARKLLRRAVLTPGDGDVTVEDQGSVSLSFANQALLVSAVTLRALALLGARRMEPGATNLIPGHCVR
jgi:hypothetical protein